MSPARPPLIYLVSDGTCRTCEQVVRAALVQFETGGVRLVRKANVHRAATVDKVVQSAAKNGALVFYTLVSKEARTAIQAAARKYTHPAVDLLGPVLSSLNDSLQLAPRAEPGILYELNKQAFDRIDAVEYTLAHDDGCSIRELHLADVVLVGVSRTCKSTTCFYLAYSGIRAANVPLFPDAEPPPELLRIEPQRVIGLTSNPYRLQSVREARLQGWGVNPAGEYAARSQIARELRAANELMEKHGWHCIDTSYRAVEEVAREVVQRLRATGLLPAHEGERPAR